MATQYIKNFKGNIFQKVVNFFESGMCSASPIWRGTVYVGIQPIYVECHVQWMAEKIEKIFVNTLPNQCVDGAKKLYILKNGLPDFLPVPVLKNPDIYFCGDDVCAVPDMIVHTNCVFFKHNDICYISLNNNDLNNFFHFGENHLFMRLFYYVLQPTTTTVVHGAVVGYNGNGVLISGASGAGKSTLSAYCLSKGLQFIGDDRVALHVDNGDVIADPIYTTISVNTHIPNIIHTDVVRPQYSNKDIIFLDKSHISNNVKIVAVVEPYKTDADWPTLEPVSKPAVITRMCKDYSHLSILARSTNLMADYKRIFDLLCGCDFYNMKLSKSIDENAQCIADLVKDKDCQNV